MPGKLPKPIQVLLLEGNRAHLTKDVIQERLAAQIRIGNHEFRKPEIVAKNAWASKKWDEIIGLILDVDADFISTSDAGIIEMCCMTYAEYMALQEVRDSINERAKKSGWDNIKTYHATDKVNLENNINKKLDLLLKINRELFLTPLSKVRNIALTDKEKKETPLEKMGFGNL